MKKDYWDKTKIVLQSIIALVAILVTVFYYITDSNLLSKNLADQIAEQAEISMKAYEDQAKYLELYKQLEKRVNKQLETTDAHKTIKLDDQNLDKIIKYLIADDNFKSKILKSISEAPTSGFVLANEYIKDKDVSKQKFKNIDEKIDKLLPIYNAIDLSNREKTLAIPLIRKDILFLIENLKETKKSIDRNILTLQTEIATETNRIYDLGKWFLGILVAALVIPLIETAFKSRKNIEKDDEEN